MRSAVTAADFRTRGIRRGMRDGVEVHKAAVAAGCDTTLYPRQVLRVSAPSGANAAFTHGLPQSSTLSGVTFTQDLRMRRGMLGKAGIQQPRGATFSIGRGKRAAQRYAERLGYPVVVKPEWGDSTIDVVRGVQTDKDLARALDTLLVPPHERPNSTQAAYGLTELRKPGFKNGRETVPPGYRVLVEEEISGDYYRLLVLNGQIVDVLQTPGGPWGKKAPIDPELSEELRAHFSETVDQVCSALTGLTVLTVDVVVPRKGSAAEGPFIVEVSERPWLEVQHRSDPVRAAWLAGKILTSELPDLTAPASEPSSAELQIQFKGVVSPEEFVTVLEAYAQSVDTVASVRDTDRVQGTVFANLTGPTSNIAEMVEVFLDSGVNGQTAMKAELKR